MMYTDEERTKSGRRGEVLWGAAGGLARLMVSASGRGKCICNARVNKERHGGASL